MKARAKTISEQNVKIPLEYFWKKHFGIFKYNLNVKFGRTFEISHHCYGVESVC